MRHLINLTASVVLLAASFVATPAKAVDGPTQKELFELRGECAQLAKAKENELNAKLPPGFTTTFSSQYDVKDNRCYVEVRYYTADTIVYQLQNFLLDGQSGKTLAQTEERGLLRPAKIGELNGAVFDPQHHSRLPSFDDVGAKEWGRATHKDAMDYINEKMGDNAIKPF